MNDLSEQFSIRDVIGDYLTTIGERNDRIVVVNADLMGSCRTRSFNEKFPDRSFNVGIAEQYMISLAAGLSHEGFITYAFSMAPFISMRACEQVRDDVAYADAKVRLIGSYAGVSGGISGATHWSIEDVGIMTSIPNITVIELSDPVQAKRVLDKSINQEGPMYIRSSVEKVPNLYDEDSYHVEIGKASYINWGKCDGAFICSGITVKYAVEAAKRIQYKYGKKIGIIDMFTIKPIDKEAVLAAADTGAIVCAQDHNIYGGLGSQVAMVLAENGNGVKFRNIGIPDKFVAMAHATYLYHQFGYDTDGLERAMLQLLR